MVIGVYRIYLGCTWTDDEAVVRLSRDLDTIPEFLYRLDRLPEEMRGEDAACPNLRAMVRIAMTQAHVCLVQGDVADALTATAAHEFDLARTGFRRRIPTVLIGPANDGHASSLSKLADVTVGWEAANIACAIQQVSEQAGADWRAQVRSAATSFVSPPSPAPTATQRPSVSRNDVLASALPVAEIERAFDDFRAGRIAGKLQLP